MWATIMCTAMGVMMIVLSIILLSGRGSFLIAGFNSMPKEEKEKYDTAALCKFIGKILLPIALLMILLGVFIENPDVMSWFMWVYLTGVVGISLFTVAYVNSGDRFKK